LSDTPPFNLEAITQLSQGDRGFELELLNIFIADTQGHLTVLHTALAQQQWDTVRKLAHQIKGTSGYLNAHTMQSLAQQLEHEPASPKASEQLAQLEVILNRLITFVREEYG